MFMNMALYWNTRVVLTSTAFKKVNDGILFSGRTTHSIDL